MKILAKVLVGSRLHGLNNEKSDYDFRGIHITPLKEFISPFKTIKNTSWLEGEIDDTSYELADFCKQSIYGNATILEVFFSNKIIDTSDTHKKMQENWIKFMDTKKFVLASRGYAHNQWNKFYNFEDIGNSNNERTNKFAIAFLRVMWQCEQFLLTGEFKCDLSSSDLFPLMKKIKGLSRENIQPFLPEIVAAMTDMNIRLSIAESTSKFKDIKPDIKWIEEFIYEAYSNNS